MNHTKQRWKNTSQGVATRQMFTSNWGTFLMNVLSEAESFFFDSLLETRVGKLGWDFPWLLHRATGAIRWLGGGLAKCLGYFGITWANSKVCRIQVPLHRFGGPNTRDRLMKAFFHRFFVLPLPPLSLSVYGRESISGVTAQETV